MVKTKQLKIFKEIIAFTLVGCAWSWVFYLMKRSNAKYNTRSPETQTLDFEINKSQTEKLLIDAKPEEIVLYLNYFDRYACPYYSDRADLIAPEINRLAQFLRSWGSKIMFHTLTIGSTRTKTNREIQKFEDNYLNETSPLFRDKCLFADYDDKPEHVSGAIHEQIRYSRESDYFASDHITAAKIALDLNAKYVIVGGMRCNLWLPVAFQQIRSAGLIPIYVADLSDVAYFRELQKSKLETHVAALNHFRKWLLDHGFWTVNHFALLDRKYAPNPVLIRFDGNTEKSYYFKDYYEENEF